MAVRLGIALGYWGPTPRDDVALCQEAERLGFHSIWTAEAYGSDAVATLVWVAARTSRIRVGTGILQMPARTPATTAMTAATIDALTNGRFLLGLGASGPRVVEGWHGVPYEEPLRRTREYVRIVKMALARTPLEFSGKYYQVPYRPQTGGDLPKGLKLMLHPLRSDIPIYLGAVGPTNAALAAEIADGWLAAFLSPYRFNDVFAAPLAAGLAKRLAPGSRPAFDIAPIVPVVIGQNIARCRDVVRATLARYLGGMGTRAKNFYNDLACRYGFEEVARKVQHLYLDGRSSDATAAVPDALVDELALVGSRARVADSLAAWKECGTTTLICLTRDIKALQTMAELVAE